MNLRAGPTFPGQTELGVPLLVHLKLAVLQAARTCEVECQPPTTFAPPWPPQLMRQAESEDQELSITCLYVQLWPSIQPPSAQSELSVNEGTSWVAGAKVLIP